MVVVGAVIGVARSSSSSNSKTIVCITRVAPLTAARQGAAWPRQVAMVRRAETCYEASLSLGVERKMMKDNTGSIVS